MFCCTEKDPKEKPKNENENDETKRDEKENNNSNKELSNINSPSTSTLDIDSTSKSIDGNVIQGEKEEELKKTNEDNKKRGDEERKELEKKKRKEQRKLEEKRKELLEANKKEYGRPASLQNIGANCYLNSALQGISSCDGFVNDLHAKYKELRYSNKKGLEKMEVLNNLIRTLNGKDESGGQLEISRNPIFRQWNKPGQQDSFELLSYMINQVFNEIRKFMENNEKIKKSDINTWIKEPLPLRIIIQYEMTCGCNSPFPNPKQTQFALHVPIINIKGTNQLSDLIEDYFEPDNVLGYECDSDGCDGKQVKRYPRLIDPLPTTLCIHLQRSYWNGWSMEKINSEVKFTEELKIKEKFMSNHHNNSIPIEKIIANNAEANILIKENLNKITTSEKIVKTNNFTKENVTETDYSEMKPDETVNSEVEQDETVNSEVEQDEIRQSVLESIVSEQSVVEPNVTEQSVVKLEETNISDVNPKGVDHSKKKANEIKPNETDPIVEIAKEYNFIENNQFVVDEQSVCANYKLTSVIVHYGSVQGGHYVCYRRSEDKWFLTNDSWISDSSWDEVKNVEPYILFYEKDPK